MSVLYLKCLFETFKKHVICTIVIVTRSTNASKILNNASTVKLHCNYNVVTINVVLTSTVYLNQNLLTVFT